MSGVNWLESILAFGRAIIPRRIFRATARPYHYLLAWAGSVIYRHPSRQLKVVMITGTKGKTTTCELVSALLEAADYRTAIASTLRLKLGDQSVPNPFKMTIRGRFFLQRFLRRAVRAGCHYAIIEMTSEGSKQFRHRFIDLDAFIFTNLAPEHIESHGSYENYREAKLEIARALVNSPKPERLMIVNGDDREAGKFLALAGPRKISFHLEQLAPIAVTPRGTEFNYRGQTIITKLPGQFNLYNILAAITFAETQGLTPALIKEAIGDFGGVRGRMEPIGWQAFEVFVDYAHTPDSLKQVYQTCRQAPGAPASRRLICVLGNTGGGRDQWKRPVMGAIADQFCDQIILTNEDPYDEAPEQIVADMATGMKQKKPTVIMDRRLAIRAALRQAAAGDVVIITGKGTDPYIMGPRGQKTPWDDATVAHEELERLKSNR